MLAMVSTSEDKMESQLELLPVDILHYILTLLDPIGVISVSQTNSRLRRIVKPSSQHFVERLLAWEVLPEYGGPTYHFSSVENKINPPWSDPAWATIKFACAGCVRLLHHTKFDNRAIRSIAFRKPAPGTPAAVVASSWRPSLRGNHWGKRFWNKHQCTDEEERRIRRKYTIALTCNFGQFRFPVNLESRLATFQECGMKTFEGMSLADFNELTSDVELELLKGEAWEVERHRAGYKRRQRKCNECLFQDGILKRRAATPSPYKSTPNVPIVAGRRLPFDSGIERWFPGLVKVLESEPPEEQRINLSRDYNRGERGSCNALYMVRCRGCRRWGEIRNFTSASDSLSLDPGQHIEWSDTLLCKDCFIVQCGREKLGHALYEWIAVSLSREMRIIQRNMLWLLTQSKELPQRMQMGMSLWARNGDCWNADWSREDMEEVTAAFLRWKKKETEKGKWELPFHMFNDFNETRETWYWKVTKRWHWLKDCYDEIDGKRDVLVDWMLARDFFSLT